MTMLNTKLFQINFFGTGFYNQIVFFRNFN